MLNLLTQISVLTDETEDIEQRASFRKSIEFCGHIVFGVTASLLHIIRNISVCDYHKACTIYYLDSPPDLQHATSGPVLHHLSAVHTLMF